MSRTVDECLAPGLVVGNLTLIEPTRSPTRRGTFWKCACSCGAIVLKYAGHIKAGQAKSCGCVKGANRTHGMANSPEHRCWSRIKERCYKPTNKRFPHYGGRGIIMSPLWKDSFEAFYADMGPRPSPNHSIDRIDNNGNYEPGNCQWATSVQQNNNRSLNRHLSIDGRVMTVAQAARMTGIPHATILNRLNRGMSDEEAVTHA